MGKIADAIVHLDEAMNLLRLEAYRIDDSGAPEERPTETRMEDFTIAEEMERIDRALGPHGQTMFASMGDRVRSAYVEIKAARQALGRGNQDAG